MHAARRTKSRVFASRLERLKVWTLLWTLLEVATATGSGKAEDLG